MNIRYLTTGLAILAGTAMMAVGAQHLFAQSAAAPGPHARIESVRGNVRMNSVLFSIRCVADRKLTEGSLTVIAGKYGTKKMDTLSIWSGPSERDSLDKTGQYMMQLDKGKKGHVEVILIARAEGDAASATVKRNLYAYRLADTLLLDEHSYAALDKAEVDYLVRKKGYEGMPADSIKALDPALWKKMEAVKKNTPAGKE